LPFWNTEHTVKNHSITKNNVRAAVRWNSIDSRCSVEVTVCLKGADL